MKPKLVRIGTFSKPGFPKHEVYAYLKGGIKPRFRLAFDGYAPDGCWWEGDLEAARCFAQENLTGFVPA